MSPLLHLWIPGVFVPGAELVLEVVHHPLPVARLNRILRHDSPGSEHIVDIPIVRIRIATLSVPEPPLAPDRIRAVCH